MALNVELLRDKYILVLGYYIVVIHIYFRNALSLISQLELKSNQSTNSQLVWIFNQTFIESFYVLVTNGFNQQNR